MKHIPIRCMLGVALLVMPMIAAGIVSRADDAAKPVISVDELRQSIVMGRLGIPLGEVHVIEGIIVQDSKFPIKGRDGTRSLRVDIVEGKRLVESVAIREEQISWPQKIIPPLDTRVELAAYESGAFQGLPRGDKYRRIGQGHGFVFIPTLIVVHDFAADAFKQRSAKQP